MMRPRLQGFELAWTDAAFDTFFPEGSALPHGIAKMKPAKYLDDLLIELPLEQSIGVRVTLWIVAFAPLFTIGRFATIRDLPPSDRVMVFDRLLASSIYAVRQLVAGFKAIATLLYAQSPAIRKAMSVPRERVGSDLVRTDRLLASSGTYKKPHQGERKGERHARHGKVA